MKLTTSLLVSLTPLSLAAQTSASPLVSEINNPLLRYGAIALVIAMIWYVLYKGAYPFFLRYYRDEFCKTIFWHLFFLYTLTWGFVSLYVVVDVGFYWGWLPWGACFLMAWWLIAGLMLLLRRKPA